jgi:hypothetical protein
MQILRFLLCYRMRAKPQGRVALSGAARRGVEPLMVRVVENEALAWAAEVGELKNL